MSIKNTNDYDYIIVGAGPVGLTLAQILGVRDGKKILVVDREKTIGGCHRVRRVDGFFTEHGPRIYSNAYINFRQILTDIGGNFYDTFTPYKFTLANIGGQSITDMKIFEILAFGVAYAKLIIYPDYGRDITLSEWMNNNNFTQLTYDYLDRVCRLTDGAGAKRYTLFEFIQLLNQHTFYSIFQPKQPTDIGFLKLWEDHLKSNGKIDFMLDTYVTSINPSNINNDIVESISIENINRGNQQTITCKKGIILAIPPEHIIDLLNKSNNQKVLNSFGKYDTYNKWVSDTKYLNYIPVIFHWDKDLNLPLKYGITKSDWGLIYIVLSDYMKFDNPGSKTVISTSFTIFDKSSKVNGLNVHQTSDREQLVNEAFRQLKESYPNLPTPTKSILSPGVYRNQDNDKWMTKDQAFILTPSGYRQQQQSQIFKNLYNCGNHNGFHTYEFTSLEGAVTNAMVLGNKLVDNPDNKYKIDKSYGFVEIIRILLVLIIIGLIYWIWTNYF
tara:strand:+ start:2261 stop:3757 length:1497 start_codon:yes stop_codon:yes gene_type:complete